MRCSDYRGSTVHSISHGPVEEVGSLELTAGLGAGKMLETRLMYWRRLDQYV